MGNEAITRISSMLDDQDVIIKEIRNEVYQKLGINANSEQINEFVKESLEHFSFNQVEKDLFQQIQDTILDEVEYMEKKLQQGETVDYNVLSDNLMNKLNGLKSTNVYLDDDLKSLANNMVNRFPYMNLTREDLLYHFHKKNEEITSMITESNSIIIDEIRRCVPKLAIELEEKQKTMQEQSNNVEENNKSTLMQDDKVMPIDENIYNMDNHMSSKSEVESSFKTNEITNDKKPREEKVKEKQKTEEERNEVKSNIKKPTPIEYSADNLFMNNANYKRLFECFYELAETDIQKDAIEKIMKNGKYNNFRLNSMLSNQKHNEKAELKRRISYAEMILHDKDLFFYLADNDLNVFHGTKIDALESILSKGIHSSKKLNENDIQLKTGEEKAMNNVFAGTEKRNFISLTDDFDTSVSYAGFPYEEQTEYAKQYYGKDLKSDEDIPIMICFNGDEVAKKYNDSLVTVQSTYNEIGIASSIDASDIKCIITSYDKLEYVKNIVSNYGINVLGYDNNDKFQKRLINDKAGKFYSSNMEIDEQEFERAKKTFKTKKTNKNVQNTVDNSSEINKIQSVKHLSEDESMIVASNIKMDIVFNLIEQYNKGSSITPITDKSLIANYNLDQKIAQKLALDINTMLESYIYEKENTDYTPFVLDGFEEETNSMNEKSR